MFCVSSQNYPHLFFENNTSILKQKLSEKLIGLNDNKLVVGIAVKRY